MSPAFPGGWPSVFSGPRGPISVDPRGGVPHMRPPLTPFEPTAAVAAQPIKVIFPS